MPLIITKYQYLDIFHKAQLEASGDLHAMLDVWMKSYPEEAFQFKKVILELEALAQEENKRQIKKILAERVAAAIKNNEQKINFSELNQYIFKAKRNAFWHLHQEANKAFVFIETKQFSATQKDFSNALQLITNILILAKEKQTDPTLTDEAIAQAAEAAQEQFKFSQRYSTVFLPMYDKFKPAVLKDVERVENNLAIANEMLEIDYVWEDEEYRKAVDLFEQALTRLSQSKNQMNIEHMTLEDFTAKHDDLYASFEMMAEKDELSKRMYNDALNAFSKANTSNYRKQEVIAQINFLSRSVNLATTAIYSPHELMQKSNIDEAEALTALMEQFKQKLRKDEIRYKVAESLNVVFAALWTILIYGLLIGAVAGAIIGLGSVPLVAIFVVLLIGAIGFPIVSMLTPRNLDYRDNIKEGRKTIYNKTNSFFENTKKLVDEKGEKSPTKSSDLKNSRD